MDMNKGLQGIDLLIRPFGVEAMLGVVACEEARPAVWAVITGEVRCPREAR